MKRFIDPLKRQLIYIENKASPGYWDTQWQVGKSIRNEIMGLKTTFATRITKKYLRPEDGMILEGGCGRAQHVAALSNNGYTVVGIDYAEKTVQMLNRYVPELNILLGDVRNLPFDDGYFVGYWSIGVIEHFWGGYESIAVEMLRVIKGGGYLFLTFPYMSPLRKVTASLDLYDLWEETMPSEGFYQFALNSKLVLADFQKLGFRLIKAVPFHWVRGLGDELPAVKPLLRKLRDYEGRNVFVRCARKGISKVLSAIAPHSLLLILIKSVR